MMGSRRRRRRDFFSQVQDPGKDLFAYLFLVMLVFSFVILLTYEQKMKYVSAQKSPKEISRGTSSLVSLENRQIGKLIKRDGKIFLMFGDRVYSPDTDISILDIAGIIKTRVQNGREEKVLYIEEDPQSHIYLREYLDTFSALSHQGIDIAFAKRLATSP